MLEGGCPKPPRQPSSKPTGCPPAQPPSSLQAAQLDEAGFRAYIQHLQQGVFASCAPPADLETAHRAFQQLALQALAGGPAAPGGAPAAGQQGVQQGQQRQQARQAQQAQQDEQDEQLGRDAYLYLGSGARGNWRAALLPPDYVAALAACSCLVWLTPEGLHEVGVPCAACLRGRPQAVGCAGWACSMLRCAWSPGSAQTLLAHASQVVDGLERSMIAAECDVSYRYNAEEQVNRSFFVCRDMRVMVPHGRWFVCGCRAALTAEKRVDCRASTSHLLLQERLARVEEEALLLRWAGRGRLVPIWNHRASRRRGAHPLQLDPLLHCCRLQGGGGKAAGAGVRVSGVELPWGPRVRKAPVHLNLQCSAICD